MRALRSVFFFVFGLLLGASAVTAFAAQIEGPARYGSSVNFNYPDGLNVRRRSGPIYDWPDAPNGWGNMRDVNKISIGGRDVNIEGIRKFQPINLARSAVTMAKLAGPIGIGLTLLPYVWDAVEGWLEPAASDVDPWVWQGSWPDPPYQNFQWTGSRAGLCQEYARRHAGVRGWTLGDVTHCELFEQSLQMRYIGNGYERGAYNIATKGAAQEVQEEFTPVSDQALEDAIYIELVARGVGSDLARRLIEAGYTLAPDGHEAVGPSSIPGDTTTSTTSGPAGTTTTTTSITNNLTYNTDNTTNTTTVTVTQTTNTTTTAPDGTTTTSVDTKTPAPGETPPEEEPKAFCDLFPDASACQKLDIPEGQPVEPEEVNVTFAPSGGFGSEGGSCPSPYSFNVQGRAFSIDYQPFCNFFTAVRPVVIAMAFITAMLIALGGYKRD